MFTHTTTQILDSLRQGENAEMWRLFDARYRPVVTAFSRRRGLAEQDAEEVAQQTLAHFVTDFAAGRYERSRGRLSSYIMGIASHRISDVHRRRAQQAGSRGESILAELAGPAEGPASAGASGGAEDAEWSQAQQRVILERALDLLRHSSRLDPRTVLAFELCTLRGVPAAAAAQECMMSIAELYVAKNRALKKLRELIAELTLEFDEP